MSTTNKIFPTVIEITDSSDESDHEGDKQQHQTTSLARNTALSTTEFSAHDETTTNTSDSFGAAEILENSTSKDAPKKSHNRRKDAHHTIRSMENLSFESVLSLPGKRTDSEDSSKEPPKKKRWDESNIDAAIDGNIDDQEMTRMLRKIAYCRVFTNYLLRQYDMLAIDFKLYSNIDLLMLELKKRVDTYTAIRRSRQRLLLNREINCGNNM